jgi:hypothetical protein
MARLTFLRDVDFPDGRLHPYVGAGPGVFITAGGTRNADTTFNTHHVVVGVSFRF